MGGVLIGFAIIAFVIAVGWALARTRIVSQDGRLVLNQVAFFAASPALLFQVLAASDVSILFSNVLLVALLAFVAVAAVYWLIARIWLTRDAGRLVLGANLAGYSNVNNIGLPVAIYVIGDAQFIGPMLMLQLLVLAPTVLGALDVITSKRASLGRILTQPLRNPMLIASAAGAVVAATGVQIPDPVMAPLEILGGAAVPLMLLAFGVSLGGEKPLRPGTGRREIVLASVLKAIVMPAVAFVLARFALGMPDDLVYACTVMAALPTAQNMYTYALRYRVAQPVARDVVLITTLASLPVMLVIAWAFHG